MAFLNVSGIQSGEDDAMQRLLSASSSQKNTEAESGGNSLLDAIKRTQATPNFDEDPFALDPRKKEIKPADPSPAAAEHATAVPLKANQKAPPPPPNTPAGGKGPHAVKAPATPAARPQAQDTAMRTTSSSFKADNPTDIDELPPLSELVHPRLRRGLIENMKIESLTRIQKMCWKAMMDRSRDVLVRSETGSGKTLAYALPTVHQILCNCDIQPISRDVGTLVIVMCPTRELVLQVTDTLTELLRCAQYLTVGGIHGGENRHKEKARLRKGLPLLVTTPGRLLDHLKATASFTVSNVHTIIMDEADRLLDMGFEKAIREIVELLNAKCKDPRALKRVLVSATITDGVERLSHFALRRDVARIGETQDTFSIPATLRQHFVSVPIKHRLAVLISFLRSQFDAGAKRIAVFVSTADSAEFLYYLISRLQSPFGRRPYEGTTETRRAPPGRSTKKMLEKANEHVFGEGDEVVTFDVESDEDDRGDVPDDITSGAARRNAVLDVNVFKLHGNMSQVDRASVFHAFKHEGGGPGKNDKAVLFCTDVAARGLDMPKIEWIVHYDPPTEPTSYIHRIGRTARIGNSGDSILFLAPHEVGYASYLTNFIHSHVKAGEAGQREMTEKRYTTFLFYLTKLDPKSNHMWVQSTATLERAINHAVMRKDSSDVDSKDNLSRIALFAYQSAIRAYSGISKHLKSLFFPSSELHLGHVAQSFGIDKSPSEVQRQLQSFIREDRVLARDNRKGTGTQDRDAVRPKRQRIELEHDDRYHSMLAQKQRKVTRDWAEKRREESTKIRPLQFSEFDA